jgi:nucleotide-binding universal stress UspA family protein
MSPALVPLSMSETNIRPQPVPLRSVLVATDFSSASHTATAYAISLARSYDATLYLAHIVHPDPLRRSEESLRSDIDEAWRNGQRLTTDLLVSGELRGVKHKLLVEQGEIWEGLERLVERYSVGMIVVGTHGRTGLAKVLLGSVAERIFRQASCPVLTVGPKSVEPGRREGELRRVLYATDFTPQSLHAAGHAISLAQHYQTHLVMLHVMPETGTESRDQAEKRLMALIPADAQFQQAPEYVVTKGAPAEEILRVAEERTPELIVLGVTQPGQGAFAGRRWSVASEVAGRALCPVLTVRAPIQQITVR